MTVRHVNPEGLHRSPAFSQAVVVEQPAKTIYVGGQNGVDADGKVVGTTVEELARRFATLRPSSRARGRAWRTSCTGPSPWWTTTRSTRASPPSSRRGTRPTHRRPSRSTSSPAWAPSSSSRSTPSP